MASRTVVTLVDDLDGSEAAETVYFGLDGKTYEVDLSETNAAVLRETVASYVALGRRVGGRNSARSSRTAVPATGASAKAIREWAISQGYEVPARGRLPREVVDAFDQS